MQTIDLLKNTIDRIFLFYKNFIRTIFNLSISYSILSGLFALVLTIPLLLTLNAFGISNGDYSSWLFSGSLYNIRLFEYISAIGIMTVPIFGIYLFEKKTAENYNLKSLFECLNQRDWIIWSLLLLVILFIYTVTFTFRFSEPNYTYFNPFADSKSWPDAMIELFKTYIPYAGAMYFLILYYSKNGVQKPFFPSYKGAIFAAFILSFIVNTLLDGIQVFFTDYIVSFFAMIPFIGMFFPQVISLIFKIGFIGYTFPAIAIALTNPFKVHQELNANKLSA